MKICIMSYNQLVKYVTCYVGIMLRKNLTCLAEHDPFYLLRRKIQFVVTFTIKQVISIPWEPKNTCWHDLYIGFERYIRLGDTTGGDPTDPDFRLGLARHAHVRRLHQVPASRPCITSPHGAAPARRP